MAATPDGPDDAAHRHLIPAPDPAAASPSGDRVAVVADGDRETGRHIVRKLAEQGMRVVLGCRSPESGRTVVGSLGPLAGRVAVRQLDPAEPVSVERLAGWLYGRLGRCDVLVADASGVADEDGRAGAMDVDVVRGAVEGNLLGSWRLIQAVAPLMRAAGYGRIVVLASGGPARPRRSLAAYRVCRPAVVTLTATLAEEFAGDGILINACCAGPLQAAPDDAHQTLETPIWLATLPDDGPSGQLFAWLAPVR